MEITQQGKIGLLSHCKTWDLTEGFSTFISTLKCNLIPVQGASRKSYIPLGKDTVRHTKKKHLPCTKQRVLPIWLWTVMLASAPPAQKSNYFNGVGREIKNTQILSPAYLTYQPRRCMDIWGQKRGNALSQTHNNEICSLCQSRARSVGLMEPRSPRQEVAPSATQTGCS